MQIEYFGHACFRFTSQNGTSVVIDPFEKIGYELKKGLTASVLLLSHAHYDHSYREGVDAKYVLTKAEKTIVCGIPIEGVACFHDEKQGALRGENIAFCFCLDGLRVCHLGDLGERDVEAVCKRLPWIDVLCIPVGGKYTIDGKKAKEYVDKLSPRWAIPMHYKTPDSAIDIAGVEKFLSQYKKEEILQVEGEITLPIEKTQIIHMNKVHTNGK